MYSPQARGYYSPSPTPSPASSPFLFRPHSCRDRCWSERDLYELLGIEKDAVQCAIYMREPHPRRCRRALSRENQESIPGLVTKLASLTIPSRDADQVLWDLSSRVVCGITGFHQNKAPEVYRTWRDTLSRADPPSAYIPEAAPDRYRASRDGSPVRRVRHPRVDIPRPWQEEKVEVSLPIPRPSTPVAASALPTPPTSPDLTPAALPVTPIRQTHPTPVAPSAPSAAIPTPPASPSPQPVPTNPALPPSFTTYTQMPGPQSLLKKLLESTKDTQISPRERCTGYIYGFARNSLPGFLKIGHVKESQSESESESQCKKEHPVDRRLREWENVCGQPVREVFRGEVACAGTRRIESLVHQTLQEYRRIEHCECCGERDFLRLMEKSDALFPKKTRSESVREEEGEERERRVKEEREEEEREEEEKRKERQRKEKNEMLKNKNMRRGREMNKKGVKEEEAETATVAVKVEEEREEEVKEEETKEKVKEEEETEAEEKGKEKDESEDSKSSLKHVKKHIEWFQVDAAVAERVVDMWCLFAKQQPYNSSGYLDPCWNKVFEDELEQIASKNQDGRYQNTLAWLNSMPDKIARMDWDHSKALPPSRCCVHK